MVVVESLNGVINVKLGKQWEINWQILQTQAYIPQLHDHFLKHNPVASLSEV